ncbi:hypothetical protein C8Q70DRAFT_566362 [Cubamyces menziesii]|nr:hypothetical protein C8Q70DRAFT_566362 [Cubamyces menziesii]
MHINRSASVPPRFIPALRVKMGLTRGRLSPPRNNLLRGEPLRLHFGRGNPLPFHGSDKCLCAGPPSTTSSVSFLMLRSKRGMPRQGSSRKHHIPVISEGPIILGRSTIVLPHGPHIRSRDGPARFPRGSRYTYTRHILGPAANVHERPRQRRTSSVRWPRGGGMETPLAAECTDVGERVRSLRALD